MRTLIGIILGAMAAILICAVVANGQQANTNYSMLSVSWGVSQPIIGNTTAPGPHLWLVQPGSFVAYLWTYGRPGQSCWLFASAIPQTVGSLVLPGGIVDLDVPTATEIASYALPGTYYTCTTPVCPMAGVGIPVQIPSGIPLAVAVQEIVTDPTVAAGYRLTAAIYAMR